MSHLAAQPDSCLLEHGRLGCYQTEKNQTEEEEPGWRVTNFLHRHCHVDVNLARHSPDTQVSKLKVIIDNKHGFAH